MPGSEFLSQEFLKGIFIGKLLGEKVAALFIKAGYKSRL